MTNKIVDAWLFVLEKLCHISMLRDLKELLLHKRKEIKNTKDRDTYLS